jgi:nucleoside-diphosphate-sugar epimerase
MGADKKVHVVFGAGQVGMPLAEALAARGHQVRLVRRGSPGQDIANLTWLQGDMTNEAFAVEACRGADVVYHCANPHQLNRSDLLLPLARAARMAATRNQARLVQLDGLHGYGRPPASNWNEDVPMRPCSQKGELRAQIVRELLEAHQRGDLEGTVGQGSDFFGPGVMAAFIFGERFVSRLAHSNTVEVLGDPDQPHSYSYVTDVVNGLIVLGERDEALGKRWHLPVSWQGTTRGLVDALGKALGTRLKLRRLPDVALRIGGLIDPVVGAAREMTYGWKMPYVLDDSRFRATFGIEPTPAAEAVSKTAEWLRSMKSRAA